MLKVQGKDKVLQKLQCKFLVDCSNFRKSAVSEHSPREMHRKAEELEKIENTEKLGEKIKRKLYQQKTHQSGRA